MDQNETERALKTYEDLSRRLSYVLLRPELSDEAMEEGCRVAARYGVGAVAVRPSDVDAAARYLDGSGVAVGSVGGFPHGASTTGVKVYETRDLLRRGAKEIEVVVNTGKLVSRQFQYVETEILQMSRACHESGALLKVTLENSFLGQDLKIIAMKICKRCEADFVKDGTDFAPQGERAADLALMGGVLKGVCRMESAGVRTLDEALAAYGQGAERMATGDPAAILEEWKARIKAASDAVEDAEGAGAPPESD
jgi:deoxyribose-phosphate aldolase